MKVRLKQTFEATQWLKDGDCGISVVKTCHAPETICGRCKKRRGEHGIFNGLFLCPGDWMVDVGGLFDYTNSEELDSFHPQCFEDTFEEI